MSERVVLLTIPIDPVTADEATERLLHFLDDPNLSHVMTPNSEMLVESTRNVEFASVLQKSSLNLPDSIGLLCAATWTGQGLPQRVAGVDAVEKLCLALSGDHPIFALGGKDGVGERALARLKEKNPRLQIAGTHEGTPRDEDADAIIAEINQSGAHVLLVAFGAPAQDLWIAKHGSKLQNVRLAMGVGGTFDFLSGKVQRAPTLMRTCGLEWLWRLIKEPRRWKRIFNAVVVFPLLIVRYGRRAL